MGYLRVVAAAAAAVLITAVPAGAITNGSVDGTKHPSVGALFADFGDGPEFLCSGVLISQTAFLTAAHCTVGLGDEPLAFYASFDSSLGSSPSLIQGTMHTNPLYRVAQAEPNDLAVLTFASSVGITPAQLPTAGRLDQLRANGQLRGAKFTAVGYGDLGPTLGGGPPVFTLTGDRMYSVGTFSSLNRAWLRLSQNAAKGNGGTCYGDSGGPNFFGAGSAETNVVASLTNNGDSQCLATNTTYRLDTAAARSFLDDFVTLP